MPIHIMRTLNVARENDPSITESLHIIFIIHLVTFLRKEKAFSFEPRNSHPLFIPLIL